VPERENRFHEIDHTADIGIEIEAESAAKLFAAAAEAFYTLIADPSGIEPKKEISISATGEDWDDLLQAWLSELLAEFNLKGFIGKRCKVTNIAEFQGVGSPGSKTPGPLSRSGRVDGKIKGEVLDLKRHRFHTEIKGVTYHELKVWQQDGKWYARVIFDV